MITLEQVTHEKDFITYGISFALPNKTPKNSLDLKNSQFYSFQNDGCDRVCVLFYQKIAQLRLKKQSINLNNN